MLLIINPDYRELKSVNGLVHEDKVLLPMRTVFQLFCFQTFELVVVVVVAVVIVVVGQTLGLQAPGCLPPMRFLTIRR